MRSGAQPMGSTSTGRTTPTRKGVEAARLSTTRRGMDRPKRSARAATASSRAPATGTASPRERRSRSPPAASHRADRRTPAR